MCNMSSFNTGMRMINTKFKVVVISRGEARGWDQEKIQCISSILFIKLGDAFPVFILCFICMYQIYNFKTVE